ncbi:DUF1302 domain-containing protein [Pseudomonas sp. JS3066]|jgi:hypothetical protein|uniref:DUF1302 domain-containing protein n=1 Tax=unclassified Pseudomonas TaxID=196821 RepID=UPI000EA947BF|nr:MULTISPECIES: DUF1302 domain-containing protein [unclassified Pseudomonas]AYF87400.1 DUF1302 domain-containing protein [Pseudomonas sp. DY-1]MDH4656700.1 DUF1302 domain-containing protein [Pseudomonas sp. BN606]MRK23098.1 DUF1302 domain-containing protein [Pseudomonas sp. JG-B]WVK95072.1 DUF1302 domain-containing protein [Pseudomonas sp. JS3066]
MELKSRKPTLRFAPAKAGFAFAGILPLLVAAQAQAVEFSFANDEISGSLDTTVSYGQLWRVQGQDKTNNDINTNDGNRNFDTGLVSEVYKITSDLEATYKNYGMFVRGTAFYDTQIMDKRNDYLDNNNPVQPSQNFPKDDSFTYETRHKAGRDAQILDAYLYGNWDVADMPVTGRVGKQVFNWGEGIFYRGGVNTTNPVDAAKFRLPGSELKEVLVPVEALSFNVGLTENLSMETFYQWNWKESAIDPVGTFYSETDLFADGGNTAYSTQRALQPLAPLYSGLSAAGIGGLQGGRNVDANGVIKVASIGPDINAKNDGQFGVALRYIAEELNSTEFGFYFVNYHAKEPTIAANLGDYAGLNLAQIAGAASTAIAPQVQQAVAAQAGISVAQLRAVLANPALNPALARAYSNALTTAATTAAGGLATMDVANAVQAQREYAEDIRMYGFSFNTTVGDASVFGELAYRPNLPIGIATTNDLLGDLLLQAPQLASGRTVNIGGQDVQLGDSIHNSERVEAFNTSLGTIYNFGPSLSFDSLIGVAELASEHLRGSDLQYTAFNGQKRYYSGRGNNSYVSGGERDDQVNKNAYGYTLLVSGTWNDVYAGVNISPYVVYKDDFEGNSYQTGSFIEGRKAYTLGVKATYLNSLEAELQYTEFYGGGQNNSVRDRDNIGVNVKYSF